MPLVQARSLLYKDSSSALSKIVNIYFNNGTSFTRKALTVLLGGSFAREATNDRMMQSLRTVENARSAFEISGDRRALWVPLPSVRVPEPWPIAGPR